MKQTLKMALGFLLVFLVMGGMGCGKKDEPPAPPPPPQNPNPAPGGPGVGIGNCGAVPGGQPLHADGTPYYAQLNSLSGGSSNSLEIRLNYLAQTYAEFSRQNIVGAGTFNFSDLNQILGGYSYVPSTAFCVSSANPNGGNVVPGTYYAGGRQISITLSGLAQVPMTTPFNPYGYGGAGAPGAPSYSPTLVEVAIGGGSYGCQAILTEGRIQGCVIVNIGQGYGRISYQYEADGGGYGYGGGYGGYYY